ncbi:MAG: LamB/YcsF family protein [Alphaproteobacteria bacterium]|nr:LamB/YcsF family protein [Alphaproteobacteria bacterium]
MPHSNAPLPQFLCLNADLGESFGPWTMGHDGEMMAHIQSANIACGFHAGDALVMRKTLGLARQFGLSVGAHVAFPDLQGFGRRPMVLPPAELKAMIQYQIGALQALARLEGLVLSHVKPHGALNNMAASDAATARVVAEAIAELDRELILLAPAASCLTAAGIEFGLPIAAEIFADRAYTESGELLSRRLPGAVLTDKAAILQHVATMLKAGGIVTQSGRVIQSPIHSICVHGDNLHAVAIAAALQQNLSEIGIKLCRLPEIIAR